MAIRTTGDMRLYASNSNKESIDTVPQNMLLEITDVKMRVDSSNIYYAKVRDYKKQFVGWVSLGSAHYELLEGPKTVETPKAYDSNRYMTYTNSDGTYVSYDARGTTYNF